MPDYNEVAHIPLMVHMPGGEGGGKRIDAITQNIDLFPTLLEHFRDDPSRCRNLLHGKSWLLLLRGEASSIRDYALYGYYGKNVNVTDGAYTYFRASVHEDNSPLYLYTTMPSTNGHYFGLDAIRYTSRIEMWPYLKWSSFPVYRIPSNNVIMKDQTQTFELRGAWMREHHLYCIRDDYAQNARLQDEAAERRMLALLARGLREHDSPDEQYERLGIAPNALG